MCVMVVAGGRIEPPMPAKIAFGEKRQTPGHYVDVALLYTQSVSKERRFVGISAGF